MRAKVLLSTVVGVGVFGTGGASVNTALAGSNPSVVSIRIAPAWVNAGGSVYETRSNYTPVLVVDYAFPITDQFQLKASVLQGLRGDNRFIAILGTYHFNRLYGLQKQLSETVELTTYQRWRPYVDAGVGIHQVNLGLTVRRVTQEFTLDAFGGMGRVGMGYFLARNWEMRAEAFGSFAVSSEITASSYGLSLGLAFLFASP